MQKQKLVEGVVRIAMTHNGQGLPPVWGIELQMLNRKLFKR